MNPTSPGRDQNTTVSTPTTNATNTTNTSQLSLSLPLPPQSSPVLSNAQLLASLTPPAPIQRKVHQVETDDIVFSPSDITIVKELTRNNTSVFYEGIMKSSHEKVMIKKPLLPDDATKHKNFLLELTEMWKQEVRLMPVVASPHLARLVGSVVNGTPDMMIVYEYVGHVTLYNLLHNQNNGANNSSNMDSNNNSEIGFLQTHDQLIQIALDIASSIKHLHSLNVIHRDIKSANIMFDNNGKAKLIDYSLACFIDNEEDLKPETGTYRYMAPEIIRHEKYSLSADVYSFGIFLWELFFKTTPFQGLNPIEAAYSVAKSNLRPVIPDGTNPHLRSLIITCWHPNPDSRPKFREICSILSTLRS